MLNLKSLKRSEKYMKLKDAIKITKGLGLICTDEEKDYKFASSIECGSLISSDYIYIPLIENNENVFEEIEKHLKNKACKGFYLNKAILQKPENQIHYHNIMKTYSSKIEAVVLARNTFNSGYEIGEANIKNFNPEIVSIAGTEEKNVVANFVSYVLSSKAKTACFSKNAAPWQKLIEPMLNVDEKTKYCVVELIPSKTNIYQYAKNALRNNTLIFTKTHLNFLGRYNSDKDKFIDEIASCADNSDYIKNVFTFEENDIVNSSIKTNKINIIQESNIKTDITKPSIFNKRHLVIKYENTVLNTNNYSYYIPRCMVISYFALKSLGIDEKYIKKMMVNFKDTSGIYEETKLNFNNYLVMSTHDHTSYSIKNAVKQFSYEYDGFKKIILLSKIENLGNYSNDIHKELLKDLAKKEFDTVVLINMSDFTADYRVYNKKTFVKRFRINKDTNHRSFILDLKQFLESRIDKNTAMLVCVPSDINLNALFDAGEINKCATA